MNFENQWCYIMSALVLTQRSNLLSKIISFVELLSFHESSSTQVEMRSDRPLSALFKSSRFFSFSEKSDSTEPRRDCIKNRFWRHINTGELDTAPKSPERLSNQEHMSVDIFACFLFLPLLFREANGRRFSSRPSVSEICLKYCGRKVESNLSCRGYLPCGTYSLWWFPMQKRSVKMAPLPSFRYSTVPCYRISRTGAQAECNIGTICGMTLVQRWHILPVMIIPPGEFYQGTFWYSTLLLCQRYV